MSFVSAEVQRPQELGAQAERGGFEDWVGGHKSGPVVRSGSSVHTKGSAGISQAGHDDIYVLGRKVKGGLKGKFGGKGFWKSEGWDSLAHCTGEGEGAQVPVVYQAAGQDRTAGTARGDRAGERLRVAVTCPVQLWKAIADAQYRTGVRSGPRGRGWARKGAQETSVLSVVAEAKAMVRAPWE